ncbi:MAG: HIT domain-containing protein [bacterium]|nr:HIT domain-containing protein [bacterium]
MNSELRQDLVSGDWVVIVPKRVKRLEQFIKKEKRIKSPIKGCPFENPQKSGNEQPTLIYPQNSKLKTQNFSGWQVQVIPNKYPALIRKNVCPAVLKNGPYSVIEGIGHHDLVITRDHHKNFPLLDKKSANLVFQAFQERYRILIKDSCSAYVSIFHNWGPKAGASIYHPHYQIISIPVVPPDIGHSLSGSADYFKKNKKCVHCVMIEWEKRIKKRIVYENKGAIVFTPFVSREPFELRIFPKKHLPCFEDTSKQDLELVVEALQKALTKIEIKLNDPDYNFFIHTAPILNKKNYKHYHWHIEIQPKISISAGFELGTGIEITVVDPDEAARILR